MIDSGIFGENDNVNETISDDIFDGIIDILDFPMEDTDVGGEVQELQGESSPLNDFLALPCPFSGNSCNETSNLRKVPCAGTQIEPMTVIDTCSGNISLHGDFSDDKESLQLQNSITSESGKSASEPFAQTTETSEGCSNSIKGKQKKKKRKKLSQLSGPMGVKKQWRCMHCNATRTPQWREGPYGPKTLCNACGVCYRRGSLFPEYRPASSPTFVATLHTNFRRKVVEMRHKAGQEHAAVGATSLYSNSHSKVTKTSYKDSQVGATFLTTSDSKPAQKVTKVDTKASTGVSPISVASLPPPQRKVNEMRSDGVQEEKLAAPMTPTFVASLHSNSHKKCSFQRLVTVRKCIHCEATKTPLWRRGPRGSKSLCNACGLRYRSGRLFPEYHPAASPTFVASFHSNSHKKVLEMRNKAINRQQLSSAAPDMAMPHNPSQLSP